MLGSFMVRLPCATASAGLVGVGCGGERFGICGGHVVDGFLDVAGERAECVEAVGVECWRGGYVLVVVVSPLVCGWLADMVVHFSVFLC